MLDAEWPHAIARDRAEPGQCRRMSIEHADDAAMRRYGGTQALDVRSRVHEAALARALRRGPARVEAIGRCDRQQPDVTAVFRHQADGLDRFGGDSAGIGDDDLAIWARLAVPISAIDDLLPQLRRHLPLDLLDRPGR